MACTLVDAVVSCRVSYPLEPHWLAKYSPPKVHAFPLLLVLSNKCFYPAITKKASPTGEAFNYKSIGLFRLCFFAAFATFHFLLQVSQDA
jgi:hypothetical protein